MRSLGWLCLLGGLVGSLPAFSQVLTNQYLNGKYYLRQVSLGTSAGGSLTDARSLLATVTFDGAGGFTFTGQQVIGAGAATAFSGSGKYSVDPAGFVTMDSPLRKGVSVNARVGPEALLGSSTESADGAYDLLVAIPAPSKQPVLSGSYWSVTLEFPAGSTGAVRNTFFSLAPGATAGNWANFTVSGHAANVQNGLPQTQAVTGATYTLNPDGSGVTTFGAGALLSGGKTFYVSADGNVILGGSTGNGSHDILIGIKSIGSGSFTWNNDFWGAGLRLDLGQTFSSYAGSVAARGLGFVTWSKRYKMLGAGTFDFTGVNPYTLASNGSGTAELAQVGVGVGNAGFVGSAIDATAPNAYEIYFGAQAAPLSGTGVFLNPRGVVNLASFSPAGTPISPGEFVALFGSGLSTATQQVKTLPFPLSLNNVSVLINGRQAPVYYVASDRVYLTVPWGTTGPTATITVQNGTAKSNSVTVPVAATAPGVFSLDQTGAGAAAIRHLDATVVNAQNPAVKGETVSIYLTGLGAVAPPLGDGAAGQSSPLNQTALPGGTACDANSFCVLIGGLPAAIGYSGLVPGLAGVYQINVTVPSVSVSGSVPLAIETPNAFHDQVTIAIQ
jgi:uncharacterized protein (TIGR03437 family)